MRKLDFCLCKNKGADQLRSNCEATETSKPGFLALQLKELHFYETIVAAPMLRQQVAYNHLTDSAMDMGSILN